MSLSSETKRKLMTTPVRKPCCAAQELAVICTCVGYEITNDLAEVYCSGAIAAYLRMLIRALSSNMMTIEYDGKQKKHVRFFAQLLENVPIESACCSWSAVKAFFIASGFLSNSDGYRVEFSVKTDLIAQQLLQLLQSVQITAHLAQRKGKSVVYIKESRMVLLLLGQIGAHAALLQMENDLIVRELNNDVNRRINCDNANIDRVLRAGMRQVDDIQFLMDCRVFETLSLPLREVGALRLEYPEASLQELAELAEMSRSNINHKLRKLSSIADTLRTGDAPLRA